MEAYFLASGVKHELDLFESIMQSQVFDLPFKKDGKDYKQPYYGILAPLRFYKFVFPKEYLAQNMKMLGLSKGGNYYDKMFNVQGMALRKILKAKRFPEIPKNTPERFFPKQLHVAIKGIGYKEDKEIAYEMEGSKVEHEGI
jgi:hypothetical protein